MSRKRETVLERKLCPTCKRTVNVFRYVKGNWEECFTCRQEKY